MKKRFDARPIRDFDTDFVFFDEVDEGGSFDLDRLTLAVVQCQHEVEEVALTKVARRLLLKVRPSDAQTLHIQTHYTNIIYYPV